MTTDLFIVRSVADLRGCKNVGIRWFVFGRATPLDLPVAEFVKDYDGIVGDNDDDTEMLRHYADTALHEHFTEAEANALADYLRTSHDDHPFIKKVELPIENNTMPISYMPLGGLLDCIVLHRREDYPLPFLVEGYYDLRDVYDENGRFLGAREDEENLIPPEQDIITPEQAALIEAARLKAERRMREREADPEAKEQDERPF